MPFAKTIQQQFIKYKNKLKNYIIYTNVLSCSWLIHWNQVTVLVVKKKKKRRAKEIKEIWIKRKKMKNKRREKKWDRRKLVGIGVVYSVYILYLLYHSCNSSGLFVSYFPALLFIMLAASEINIILLLLDLFFLFFLSF